MTRTTAGWGLGALLLAACLESGAVARAPQASAGHTTPEGGEAPAGQPPGGPLYVPYDYTAPGRPTPGAGAAAAYVRTRDGSHFVLALVESDTALLRSSLRPGEARLALLMHTTAWGAGVPPLAVAWSPGAAHRPLVVTDTLLSLPPGVWPLDAFFGFVLADDATDSVSTVRAYSEVLRTMLDVPVRRLAPAPARVGGRDVLAQRVDVGEGPLLTSYWVARTPLPWIVGFERRAVGVRLWAARLPAETCHSPACTLVGVPHVP